MMGEPSAGRPRVGFVGLGRMGSAMAANIARAGFPLIGWSRDAAKARSLAQSAGCEAADTAEEAVRRSEIVVSMLSDGDALQEVLSASPEMVGALAGRLLVNMGTIGPRQVAELARRLTAAGARFVDAPVSGSTAAAGAGSLTILVGAEDADFARVEPVLRSIGDQIRRVGAPGSASLAKLAINNLIFGINQCVSESLLLAERGGLDRTAAYEIFLSSAAAAPVMRYRREAFLHPGEVPVSFTLALAEKDMRLIGELAEELGEPMPQADLNRRIARAAIAAGYGEREVADVAEYLRSESRRSG